MANFNKRCQMFASIIYIALFGSNWGGRNSAGAAASATATECPSAWGASSHSSWGCVIGLSTMFSFFCLVRFDSSLSLWHRPAKRLKAAAAAFVVDARAPRFCVSSSAALCAGQLACAEREAHLSN